jgi:hypothetical protein
MGAFYKIGRGFTAKIALNNTFLLPKAVKKIGWSCFKTRQWPVQGLPLQ